MAHRRTWLSGMVLIGAVVALAVAACGGAPAAPAPAGHVLSSSDTDNANGDDAYSALSQSSRLAAPDATPAPAVAPEGPKLMSPAEAQSAAPFAYGVPAWAPPGFQLQPQVEVIAQPASDGFASAGERIGALGVPAAIVQEGGYNTTVLGELLGRFLDGFGR